MDRTTQLYYGLAVLWAGLESEKYVGICYQNVYPKPTCNLGTAYINTAQDLIQQNASLSLEWQSVWSKV